MGKHGESNKNKHHNQARSSRRRSFSAADDGESEPYSLALPPSSPNSDEEIDNIEEEEDEFNRGFEGENPNPSGDNVPSKFMLYQQSVQSPKGATCASSS
ncbi:hypothetical protein AKJ16_DCAP03754 [Drosera capensis]